MLYKWFLQSGNVKWLNINCVMVSKKIKMTLSAWFWRLF